MEPHHRSSFSLSRSPVVYFGTAVRSRPAVRPIDCTGFESTTSFVAPLVLGLDPLLKSQSACIDDKMQALCNGAADWDAVSNSQDASTSFWTSVAAADRRWSELSIGERDDLPSLEKWSLHIYRHGNISIPTTSSCSGSSQQLHSAHQVSDHQFPSSVDLNKQPSRCVTLLLLLPSSALSPPLPS